MVNLETAAARRSFATSSCLWGAEDTIASRDGARVLCSHGSDFVSCRLILQIVLQLSTFYKLSLLYRPSRFTAAVVTESILRAYDWPSFHQTVTVLRT